MSLEANLPESTQVEVARAPNRRSAPRAFGVRFWVTVVGLMAAHAFLGLLMRRYPVLSVSHTVLIALFGAWLGLTDRSGFRPALLCAYITGAEALWRMTGGSIVWEFGKYSIVGILGLSMLRFQRFRIPLLPLSYLALLLPATILTLISNDLATSRNLISMNLSGPLALGVCVAFFSQMRFQPQDRLKILLGLIIPIGGVAAVCLQSIGEGDIYFGSSSNMAASGGFGPNQVSATLGLAVLISFLCLGHPSTPAAVKPLFVLSALLFAAQSALTLSRSGLYFSGLSILAATLVQLKDAQRMIQTSAALVVILVLGYFVVYPQLDEFTNGAISKRFENRSMTGREEIMEADLQIMMDNLPLGVGVGMAKEERGKYFRQKASHTEYTRLIAEHGLFGVAALVLLLVMAGQIAWQAQGFSGRGFAVGLVAFSLLFMTGSGMRLVMSGFLFGLAATRWAALPKRLPRPASAPTETLPEVTTSPEGAGG